MLTYISLISPQEELTEELTAQFYSSLAPSGTETAKWLPLYPVKPGKLPEEHPQEHRFLYPMSSPGSPDGSTQSCAPLFSGCRRPMTDIVAQEGD